ncbi:MAG: type II secretion system protein [bacterium]
MKIVYSKKGFTILEAMIALAIITVTALAVFSLVSSYREQTKSIEVKTGFEGALSQALDEAHKMLRETTDSNGNLTIGACSFMTTTQTTPGLGFIRVDLPLEDPFSNEKKIWGWGSTKRSVFPESDWISSDCDDLKDSNGENIFTKINNSYQRCFKPRNLDSSSPFGMPVGLVPYDPSFRTIITPIRVRVEGQTDSKGNKITSDQFKGYQVLNLPTNQINKADARDVALLLTAEVSFKKGNGLRISKTQSLLKWFGEFPCHKIISPTNKIVMRPSGFGSGDDSFSLFSASENSDQSVFKVSQKVKVFTEGTVIQERGMRLLDKVNLAGAACIEKPVFNCKFKSKTENVWRSDSLSAILKIKYNRNNALYSGSSIGVKPSLSLRSKTNNLGNNSEDIPLDSNFYLASSTGNISANDGLTITSSQVALYSDAKSPAKACTQVCNADNKFNTDTNPYILNYGLYSSVLKQTIDTSDISSNVGCVCCYAKQCSAIGTKVQSWCGQQPDEALDSRVPECASDYDNPSTQAGLKELSSLDNSTTNKRFSLEVSKAIEGNCLVGEKSSDKISVSPSSCDSKRRVLCYSSGRFILTPNVFLRKDAAQACYDLSAESMLASEVDDRVVSQVNGLTADAWNKLKTKVLPPIKNGRYVFRNAAMAGVFISPQEEIQLASVINNSDIPKSTKFWIALRTNWKGDVVSAVPMIPPQVSPYISYFDGDGRLIFLMEENTCTLSNPGDCLPYESVSDGPVVLQHARTRFGATAINPSTVKEEFSALCFNPQDKTFFKTKTKTKVQDDAIALCMREGGIFFSPARPLQWVASLKATKPMFNQLSFPIYLKKETLAAGVAWTSLTSQTGKYAQVLPKNPSQVFLADNSGKILPENVVNTCLVDKEFKAIAFDRINQTPTPKYYLKREGGKLVLASGAMPEGSSDLWVLNEDDFLSLSTDILNEKPENIQFKECPKPPPGLCGAANGIAVFFAPTKDLCAVGTPTSVSGLGPWDWRCQSAGNSTAASCSAPKGEMPKVVAEGGYRIVEGRCSAKNNTIGCFVFLGVDGVGSHQCLPDEEFVGIKVACSSRSYMTNGNMLRYLSFDDNSVVDNTKQLDIPWNTMQSYGTNGPEAPSQSFGECSLGSQSFKYDPSNSTYQRLIDFNSFKSAVVKAGVKDHGGYFGLTCKPSSPNDECTIQTIQKCKAIKSWWNDNKPYTDVFIEFSSVDHWYSHNKFRTGYEYESMHSYLPSCPKGTELTGIRAYCEVLQGFDDVSFSALWAWGLFQNSQNKTYDTRAPWNLYGFGKRSYSSQKDGSTTGWKDSIIFFTPYTMNAIPPHYCAIDKKYDMPARIYRPDNWAFGLEQPFDLESVKKNLQTGNHEIYCGGKTDPNATKPEEKGLSCAVSGLLRCSPIKQ